MQEQLRLHGGIAPPQLLSDALQKFPSELDALPAALFSPIPLGISTLDDNFGGGVHPKDLLLIAGKQNVGKTILMLQIARHIAKWSKERDNNIAPFVICYEHDPWTLFVRLLCQESYHSNPDAPIRFDEVINTLVKIKETNPDSGTQPALDTLASLLMELPTPAMNAYNAISGYADRLFIYHGDIQYTTVTQIEEAMDYFRAQHGLYLIPIIDYVQIVPAPSEFVDKERGDPDTVRSENLRRLKALANRKHVPVIGVAAVGKDALIRPGPVHIEDVLGPETIPYTIDIGVILNRDVIETRDLDVISRNIRISIEKNRRGPSEKEWQHKILGGSFHISAEGREVPYDESFQAERVKILAELEEKRKKGGGYHSAG